MSNQFTYKGYSGSCLSSIEDECLHGRILFITDLITYEGNTIPELRASFEMAVDDYLNYCKETGKQAEKPYSGSFNVRIPPELHKELAKRASRHGMTINEFVKHAIEKEVKPKTLSYLTLEKSDLIVAKNPDFSQTASPQKCFVSDQPMTQFAKAGIKTTLAPLEINPKNHLAKH